MAKLEEEGFAQGVFHKLFKSDMLYLANLKNFWKDKEPPIPLSYNDAMDTPGEDISRGILEDETEWSVKNNARIFVET